jgi:site-specific DNA-methyltransferase (adenine-specific)
MTRRSTSTSAFGVSKRESHDASGFYRRFTAPQVSDDADIGAFRAVDKLIVGDARHMDEVADATVALVVTSPPYFAGKEYEESLGAGGVPGSYLEYLQLLRDVLAEAVRTLEPGGRIAVNVANLGRRPYRSLSADVIRILQDDLRLLLRGEIVWVKQRGSSGSCAWGSFQRPGNPVLRDVTERVVVASKGRFDRAVAAPARARRRLPSESSITREDFMENTLDVWEIPAESASRVGHPAPFPVELPARLIELYTYRGDLVLDPFAGSGSTAVAAVRAGRHFVGYDTDADYVQLAERRVEEERRRPGPRLPVGVAARPAGVAGDGVAGDGDAIPAFARALREGRSAKDASELLLTTAGFRAVETDARRPGGVEVSFAALDAAGRPWLFEVAGTWSGHRPGLKRSDVLWKLIAKAAILHAAGCEPFVVLTAGIPGPGGPAAEALKQVVGPTKPIRGVIDVTSETAPEALSTLAGVRAI